MAQTKKLKIPVVWYSDWDEARWKKECESVTIALEGRLGDLEFHPIRSSNTEDWEFEQEEIEISPEGEFVQRS